MKNMIHDAQVISQTAKNTYARALDRLTGVSSPEEFAEFVAVANDVTIFSSYKVFSAKARTIVGRITSSADAATSRFFLSGAIALAVVNTLASDRFTQLPARVKTQHLRQLRRIVEDTNDECEWLDLDKDLFQKEFGLATLRLYAAGAQLLEVHSGIPRSIIFRETIPQALSKLGWILRLGGFRPYFQIHTHQFMLDEFNEIGWEECYLCCAELYEIHPEVLGMHGASWFYDPALQAVSPRLAYLQETPRQGGARLFFYEAGGSAIGNSIATSPTRRKLYEDGKYIPKNYMLIWGKSSQISWARRYVSLRTE